MKSFLMGRFFTRGAGFVSTKQEQTLKDLGIVNEGSRVGYRLAGEYAGRYLLKLATLSHTLRAASPVACLHFSADASRVCGKEVVAGRCVGGEGGYINKQCLCDCNQSVS